MRIVLAALDDTAGAAPVLASARALASVLGARVEAVHVRTDGTDVPTTLAAQAVVPLRVLHGDVVERLVECDRMDGVVATAIGARAQRCDPRPLGTTAIAVATRAVQPMLVVPPGTVLRPGFSRVLVPLEGSIVTSAAPEVLIELAPDADLDIVAIHVLGPDTIPAFTDQPQHEQEAWTREFLARCCPRGLKLVRLETRVGKTDDMVSQAAREYRCDLIVLGWLQNPTPGRARVVLGTLVQSPVPVLLIRVPVDAG